MEVWIWDQEGRSCQLDLPEYDQTCEIKLFDLFFPISNKNLC